MSQARPRLRLLSREQVEEVHEGSLRILLEHGVGVDSERARRVFAGASGEVHLEDGRVRLERGVVEWAIRVSPPVVEVHDRHGAPAFRLGDDRTRFGVGVTNLWYQDPLTDAVADLYAVLEMIANSTKPLVILISDESLFPAALDLVEALHVGDDRPFVIPYLNPITPLRINQGTSDKLLDALERGLPAIYSNLGMAGMTTPITCAGTLALLNAELLAGLVLSQLAREGAGVILGSLPMFFDMKTMVDFCDPQTHLIDLACAEMMAHYRVPHAGTSGSGEGWGPDLLAAAPLWTNQLTSVLGKVGLCPFVGSSLSSKAFSPALTVLGDDVIGQARLLGKGFAVDEAAIGVTETLEVLRTDGQFLLAPTTLEACFAGIFPHIGLEKWEEEGRPPADRLVRERTRDLLAEVEPPEDHDELLARGEEFLRTRGLAAPD